MKTQAGEINYKITDKIIVSGSRKGTEYYSYGLNIGNLLDNANTEQAEHDAIQEMIDVFFNSFSEFLKAHM